MKKRFLDKAGKISPFYLRMLANKFLDRAGEMSPSFLRDILVKAPYGARYGKVYKNFRKELNESQNWSQDDLENYILVNFNNIFEHSKKIKFYRDRYERSGIENLKITTIEDIRKIPVLTKTDIRENISEFNGYFKTKTGGTTGIPLHLYLDKGVWAREWAHYHHIWEGAGIKYSDAKFCFRALRLEDDFIKYIFQHNEYYINIHHIYTMSDKDLDEFFEILVARNVKYFKGYPSAIYDFLREIEKRASEQQKELLKSRIRYCLFNSEYPTINMTNYIKNVWGFSFIAGYGHTECCVLALSKANENLYIPFHTYGYAEVEDQMLIGTSYHNFDMPLIRYNTEDIVSPEYYSNNILKSFEITEGRSMHTIYDKNDLRISICTIHDYTKPEAFNYINYIQVYQEQKGRATLLISQDKHYELDYKDLLNLSQYDMDFDFIFLERPIKTNAQKVPLRVFELPK